MEAEGRLRRGWGCGLRRLHGGPLEAEGRPPQGPQCLGSGGSSGRSLSLRDLWAAVPGPGPGTHGPSELGYGSSVGVTCPVRS